MLDLVNKSDQLLAKATCWFSLSIRVSQAFSIIMEAPPYLRTMTVSFLLHRLVLVRRLPQS